MSRSTHKPRQYRKITAATVAKHKAAEAVEGNGTAAVSVLNPDYQAPHQRAYRIVKKSESMPTQAYLDTALQQIAADGVQELGELVRSTDERVKLGAIKYAVDQIRGKAVAKSITITGKMNIQSVID